MACISYFAPIFCYDNPAVLETQLEEQFEITPSKFSYLYSVYCFPNMFVPILGGFAVDKLGVRISITILIITIAIGHGIFTVGGYQESYSLMIAGRTIFGIGSESFMNA